jgi:hypothetical protein
VIREQIDANLRQADFSVAHPVAREGEKSTVSGIGEPAAIDSDLATVNAA